MAGLKKKEDIMCTRSFEIGPTRFAGTFTNIILDEEAIRIALNNKAVVKEVLKNGKRTPLDFANYNVRNPMGVNVDDQLTENSGAQHYHIQTLRPMSKSKIEANQPPIITQMGNSTPPKLSEIQSVAPVTPSPVVPKIISEAESTTAPKQEIDLKTEEEQKKEEIERAKAAVVEYKLDKNDKNVTHGNNNNKKHNK